MANMHRPSSIQMRPTFGGNHPPLRPSHQLKAPPPEAEPQSRTQTSEPSMSIGPIKNSKAHPHNSSSPKSHQINSQLYNQRPQINASDAAWMGWVSQSSPSDCNYSSSLSPSKACHPSSTKPAARLSMPQQQHQQRKNDIVPPPKVKYIRTFGPPSSPVVRQSQPQPAYDETIMTNLVPPSPIRYGNQQSVSIQSSPRRSFPSPAPHIPMAGSRQTTESPFSLPGHNLSPGAKSGPPVPFVISPTNKNDKTTNHRRHPSDQRTVTSLNSSNSSGDGSGFNQVSSDEEIDDEVDFKCCPTCGIPLFELHPTLDGQEASVSSNISALSDPTWLVESTSTRSLGRPAAISNRSVSDDSAAYSACGAGGHIIRTKTRTVIAIPLTVGGTVREGVCMLCNGGSESREKKKENDECNTTSTAPTSSCSASSSSPTASESSSSVSEEVAASAAGRVGAYHVDPVTWNCSSNPAFHHDFDSAVEVTLTSREEAMMTISRRASAPNLMAPAAPPDSVSSPLSPTKSKAVWKRLTTKRGVATNRDKQAKKPPPKETNYKGEFNVYGQLHGLGEVHWPNGDRYVGNLFNGMRDGNGTLWYMDGSEDCGEWECNKLHGKGTRRYANGDIYTGDFVNGKREGKGKLFFANGDLYNGHWKDDMMHGSACYYGTQLAFQGSYDWGTRHGKAKLQHHSSGRLDVVRYEYGVVVGPAVRWSADRTKAWALSVVTSASSVQDSAGGDRKCKRKHLRKFLVEEGLRGIHPIPAQVLKRRQRITIAEAVSIGYKCAKTMEEEDATQTDMNDNVIRASVTVQGTDGSARYEVHPTPRPLLQVPPKNITPKIDFHPVQNPSSANSKRRA